MEVRTNYNYDSVSVYTGKYDHDYSKKSEDDKVIVDSGSITIINGDETHIFNIKTIEHVVIRCSNNSINITAGISYEE